MYKLRLALALFLSASALTAAESFIRPIISSVHPDTDGYSSAIGVGLASGIYFGPNNTQELSFEWSHVRWDSDDTIAGIRVKGRETYMPFMVNYRFHFKPSENVAIYIGPSAGVASTQVDANLSGAGLRASVSDSDWVSTYGGTGGVILKLTKRIDLDVGYRYMRLGGGEYNVQGFKYETDDAGAKAFYAGIGLRF